MIFQLEVAHIESTRFEWSFSSCIGLDSHHRVTLLAYVFCFWCVNDVGECFHFLFYGHDAQYAGGEYSEKHGTDKIPPEHIY
jgi:hypothetical protein